MMITINTFFIFFTTTEKAEKSEIPKIQNLKISQSPKLQNSTKPIPYRAIPYRGVPYRVIPYPPWGLMMIRHNTCANGASLMMMIRHNTRANGATTVSLPS